MKKWFWVCLVFVLMGAMASLSCANHEHELMKMANMNCHYSECTICYELFDVGDHVFVDGICSVCGHAELVNPFQDVKETDWYFDDVLIAVDMGLVNGVSEDAYAPGDNITYAQVLKLAACMHAEYTGSILNVYVAPGEPWYQPYVKYCRDLGISGAMDHEMNDFATRARFMTIFSEALPKEAYEPINTIPEGAIPDVALDSDFAEVAYMLYRAGIITGSGENHACKPNDFITRAEVATILVRMMDPSKRVRFDMEDSIERISNNGTIEDVEINEENKAQVITNSAHEDPGIVGSDVEIKGHESIVVEITPIETEVEVSGNDLLISELSIYKQPEGYVADSYGEKIELMVQVYGGKPPYTYKWQYKVRRDTVDITNGDYAKDAQSEALILSIEKENALLGQGIFCTITDSEGKEIKTDTVYVYGPFSMAVEACTILQANKEYLLTGRIADGKIKTGDRVSVMRNGKIIAMGTVSDLQMFNKSLGEGVKGDNIGMFFTLSQGFRPTSGDTVIPYQDAHVLDTSDIVN